MSSLSLFDDLTQAPLVVPTFRCGEPVAPIPSTLSFLPPSPALQPLFLPSSPRRSAKRRGSSDHVSSSRPRSSSPFLHLDSTTNEIYMLSSANCSEFPDALGLFGPRDPTFDVRHHSTADDGNLLGLDLGGARVREKRRSQRHRIRFATSGSLDDDCASDAGKFLPALSSSADSYPSPPSDDFSSLHSPPIFALDVGAPRSSSTQFSASPVGSTSHRPYDFILPDIPHHSTWTLPSDYPPAPHSLNKRSLFLVSLPSIDLPATPALTPESTSTRLIIDLDLPAPCDDASPKVERAAFALRGNRELLPFPHPAPAEKSSWAKGRPSAPRSLPPSPAVVFDVKSTKSQLSTPRFAVSPAIRRIRHDLDLPDAPMHQALSSVMAM